LISFKDRPSTEGLFVGELMISPFLFDSKVCTDIMKVENFADTVLSKEKYELHHLAECRFTAKELIAMGKYYNRPPEEFLFVEESIHTGNQFLHKGCRKKIRKKTRSWYSEFRQKFGKCPSDYPLLFYNWKKSEKSAQNTLK